MQNSEPTHAKLTPSVRRPHRQFFGYRPLVRIDLGTLQIPTAEGQKPQLVPSQTLVMPLDGFVQSFSMMESVVKRLVADGVIGTQAPAAGSSGSEPEKLAKQ